MIYTVNDIKAKVKIVAERYDIQEIRLFGSYFNGVPTGDSDVDLIVKYGPNCRGLDRFQFMNEVEAQLGKEVDVLNVKFLPEFLTEATGIIIYTRSTSSTI